MKTFREVEGIYKTIILPVVLYGRETWSPTLREEHTLRVFEKRVLKRIFGPKRDEVRGGWRTLHNEAWKEELPHCCKLLRNNVEFIMKKSPTSKDVNTEAEEATALEAVTRQPVKTQQTEKI
jgi:hypothetical protein